MIKLALNLYHDSDSLRPINQEDKDTIRSSVVESSNWSDVKDIYIKSDDNSLTYENITIESKKEESTHEVSVTYSTNTRNGPYRESVMLDDGNYTEPSKFWRKVELIDVNQAFDRTDIKHIIEQSEFVKTE